MTSPAYVAEGVNEEKTKCTLFVGGLPLEISPEALKDYFSALVSVRVGKATLPDRLRWRTYSSKARPSSFAVGNSLVYVE